MTDGFYRVTQCQLPELWGEIEPLLTRCCERAGHGVMDANDIRERHASGKASLFVEVVESAVTLVCAVEFIKYPKLMAANVLGLGGKDLRGGISRCWPSMLKWMKRSGATVVDASCGDAMARILSRQSGFKKAYNHMRMDLEVMV